MNAPLPLAARPAPGLKFPTRLRPCFPLPPALARAAFSLVELLVVVALMIVLIGISLKAFRSGMSAASPTEAANLVSAAVLTARSQALTLRTGSRIVIDGNYDASQPDRSLRRVQLERKETNGPVDTWVPAGKALALPENVFFATDYSTGYTEPQPKKFVYEFDKAGRLIVPANQEARLVFVVGFRDPAGVLQTPAPMLPKRNGFIIRKAGRVTFFENPAQIVANP